MVGFRDRSTHYVVVRNAASAWIFLILVSVLVSACGKTAPRQPTLEGIQMRSQERLFHSAKAEFLAARYGQAVQRLRRFSSMYPRSSYQAEVLWLLARSFHELGETELALKHYQRVLNRGEAEVFHVKTRKHMASLQSSMPMPLRHQGDVFALQMTLGQWLQGRDWTARLKNMSRRGVTTQVINLECGLPKKHGAFLFRTSSRLRSSITPLSWDFPLYVKQSHEQKMSVFLGVNIRCLGWLDPDSNTRWADRAYDQDSQKLRSTKYLDIFNPEYQKVLKKMLKQLASTGVDGIIFRGEAPMGMFDGLTPIALAKFQQKFGGVFQPQSSFAKSAVVGKRRARHSVQQEEISLPKDSGFWRWVGWRARARLEVLYDLMRTLKGSHSNIQVALEVSARGLTDPLRSLVLFTEDILESTRGEFSFLLVDFRKTRDLTRGSLSRANGGMFHESLPILAKRFLEITKDPTKIWLTVPRKMEAHRWSSDSLKDLTRDTNIPQGIGLVYDLRPFS